MVDRMMTPSMTSHITVKGQGRDPNIFNASVTTGHLYRKWNALYCMVM